jgi:hypothetical protein
MSCRIAAKHYRWRSLVGGPFCGHRLSSSEALAMRLASSGIFTIALLLAATPAASVSQSATTNAVLMNGMEPFEDMVESALAGKDSGVAKAIAAADHQAASVKKALSSAAGGEFATMMDGLHRAVAAKDNHQLAASAMDLFRLLAENLPVSGLKVPREVSLLDYAGYKLQILAAAPVPDWPEIRKTAGEAADWWNVIKAMVPGKDLRGACGTAIRGLDEASKQENLAMLRFAAQVDLDLVDLLEGAFSAKR